jgi:hypothetical protein
LNARGHTCSDSVAERRERDGHRQIVNNVELSFLSI